MSSSTQDIPVVDVVPRHVAIIMDDNARCAKKRFLPPVAGHHKDVEAVCNTVRSCAELGVSALTLFAFSSENWRRPQEEVSLLMQLFVSALQQEVERLHQNNIRFRVIGDISRFDHKLIDLINAAQKLTAANTGLTLTVAANYGGRWDILQAVERLRREQGDSAAPWTEAQATVTAASGYISARVGAGLRAEVGATWRKEENVGVSALFTADLPGIRSYTNLEVPSTGSARATEQVQGSVLYDLGTNPVALSGGPSLQLGGVSGRVFLDLNGNGAKDAGEPGLAGWTIQLTGPVNASTTTGAAGDYSFTGLTVGNYQVSEVLQGGWVQSHPVGGTHAVAITSGLIVTEKNFGNYQPARISGFCLNFCFSSSSGGGKRFCLTGHS